MLFGISLVNCWSGVLRSLCLQDAMFYQDGPPLPQDPLPGGIGHTAASCRLRSSESVSNDSAQDASAGDHSNLLAPSGPDRQYRSARLQKRARLESACHTGPAHDDELPNADTPPSMRGRQDAVTADAFQAILGRRITVPRRVRSGLWQQAQNARQRSGATEGPRQNGSAPASARSQKPDMSMAGVKQHDDVCEDAVMGLLSLAECA
jgi:hypothetical protein